MAEEMPLPPQGVEETSKQGLFSPEKKEEKKSSGLFHSAKAPSVDLSGITEQLNDTVRRSRVLEERFLNLRRKSQVTEQNMLSNNKRFDDEVKLVNSDITEIKREIIDIKDKIKRIISELQNCAQKEEFITLQKYVEMWEPVNFITRKQVEELINDRLDGKE